MCGLCKGNLHRTCFEELKTFSINNNFPLTCPYCRKMWQKRKIEDEIFTCSKQQKIELFYKKQEKGLKKVSNIVFKL